jgi:hypothetical protein
MIIKRRSEPPPMESELTLKTHEISQSYAGHFAFIFTDRAQDSFVPNGFPSSVVREEGRLTD